MSEDPKLFVRRAAVAQAAGDWSFATHPDEAELNLFRYCDNDPVDFTDPMGTDTYEQNRELGGDEVRSNYNPFTHSFTFTTNADNTRVTHTYSWGNSANPRGWNKDQFEDMKAAQKALETGKGLNKVGDSTFDPYVEKAFNKLNTKQNEHQNLVVCRNCKSETKRLLREARELQKQDEKNRSQSERPRTDFRLDFQKDKAAQTISNLEYGLNPKPQ